MLVEECIGFSCSFSSDSLNRQYLFISKVWRLIKLTNVVRTMVEVIDLPGTEKKQTLWNIMTSLHNDLKTSINHNGCIMIEFLSIFFEDSWYFIELELPIMSFIILKKGLKVHLKLFPSGNNFPPPQFQTSSNYPG